MARERRDPDRIPWERRSVERRAILTAKAGGLSHAPWCVFVVLATYANSRGRHACPSLYTVADETNINVSTVRRAMRELEAEHWIVRTHRSKGGLTTRHNARNQTSVYDVLPLTDAPGVKLTAAQRKRRLLNRGRA